MILPLTLDLDDGDGDEWGTHNRHFPLLRWEIITFFIFMFC